MLPRNGLYRLGIYQASRKCTAELGFLDPSHSRLRGPTQGHSGFSTAVSQAPAAESMVFMKFDDFDEPEQARFEALQYRLAALRLSRQDLPSKLSETQWRKALTIDTKNGLSRYLRSLFLRETTNAQAKTAREQRKKLLSEKFAEVKEEIARDSGVIKYGLSFNTITRNHSDSDLTKFYNSRLVQARLFGQPLAFDLDYDEWMAEREQFNTAMQILAAHSTNKLAKDPFWIQLCNARPDGGTMQTLMRDKSSSSGATCMLEMSDKSCLELFPRERLVYLSPDAEDTLEVFSHDDIYVIGAFVNKTRPGKQSLAKAVEKGVRRAKLPLDTYLRWRPGPKKALALVEVTGILSEMKLHGDWQKALFKHVPREKYI